MSSTADSPYSTSATRPYAVIDVNEEYGQYINSFCITKNGTWLISVTTGTGDGFGTYTRRSTDRGKTWEDRVFVFQPEGLQAARTIEMGQFLPVPGTNIIYQFHVRHTREQTRFGQLHYTISRDDGRSWHGPGGPNRLFDIETPAYELSPERDGWHLMAPGLILSTGEFLLPMNISTDPLPLSEIRSELVFGISKNVMDAKSEEIAHFDFYPPPPHGVQVPLDSTPGASLGQEPQVAELSDRRIFCVCRTGNGCLYYTVSEDHGRSWREARPLRYSEGTDIVLHPNAPCPLTKLSGGRYALLFCNNDGTAFGGADPFDHTKNRQPVYVSIGRENGADTGQPLDFGPPSLLGTIEGFQPQAHWRDLTYGLLLESQGEYYHFYNAVWRFIQVNKVDPETLR